MIRPAECNEPDIEAFVALVQARGRELYRDFPWRRTHDPYAILVSEVMLQQTQVARVVAYYEQWLEQFPTIDSLAAAPLEAVLRVWQGLGYNRRAVALKRLAERLAADTGAGGEPPRLPRERDALLALPGVGPATAAGVRAFAWSEPDVYLETNVRTVVLHELLSDRDGVSDREVAPLVAQAACAANDAGIDPRTWNYALLDYGAHLKRTLPNPSRRSAHHVRQSRFEGSRRQKRARLLRLVMDRRAASAGELAESLETSENETLSLLQALRADGFVCDTGDSWNIS
jgi:A/G-specific adenine glycosylase